MTRFWPDGQPITVQVDDQGSPQMVTWEGQDHLVEGITNHWRIDQDWWLRRIWRSYFMLFTQTGLLLVIYHDLLSDRWYVQRLFD